MAHGLCDNLLLATFLSATCPVYVAPAMDLEMYRDTSTQSNLDILVKRGVRTIGPDRGDLASGLNGEGRMTEPAAMVDRLVADLMGNSPLRGRRMLITAGPTQEAIDPVRYIGNRSTGKMGFALALEAAQRGALVTLVAGPVALQIDHPGITRVDVTSAAEMAEACGRLAGTSDIIVMSAAVADLRPAHPAEQKIKKVGAEPTLRLEPTTDILAGMGRNKRPGQRLVGFALETTNELAHATDKLQRKNLDLLVLNSLRDSGAGFGHDTNKVTLLAPGTDPQELPLMSKAAVASAILDRLEQIL
jgi:phosphopantothenoylcysteine decarboxylase/phosphopantothenate--cysteine ligase